MSELKTGVSVELGSISKAFAGNRAVFEKLNLQISSGEFLSVVGASGCGKSTLLRIISGLEKPDAGTVVSEPRPEVSFVFQEACLLPWRTVAGNVALPLELKKLSPKDQNEQVQNALSQVGMAKEKDLFPAQLSGGMKMRVSLARALVTSPNLLLLDEPFGALDELFRLRLEEELRSIWARTGMTVVLVTHSFSEAVFVSDRIVMLSRRQLRVKETLSVDLGRARGQDTRAQREFADLVRDCRNRFERLENNS